MKSTMFTSNILKISIALKIAETEIDTNEILLKPVFEQSVVLHGFSIS